MEANGRWGWALGAFLLAGCATVQPAAEHPLEAFDVHAHLEPTKARGRINPGIPGTADALLGQMRSAHVTRALAIAIPDQGADAVRAANDELVAQTQGHPELIAVGALAVDDPNATLGEIDRLATAGVRAVKLSPRPGELNEPGLIEIVRHAAEKNQVVLFDGWSLEADALGKLALAVPEARIVVAHLGGVRFTDVLLFKMLERYAIYRRNVWFDLSAVAQLYAHSPYRDQLRWVCEQIGIDRVLLGSDFPMRSLSDAIADVHALGLTRAEERAVLHDNAAALFAPPPATTASTK
jgi:predicted TIM-barrel fold metal-dependent hydrolase